MQSVGMRFRRVEYAAGELIYLCGSAAERLFVVEGGTVKLLQPTSFGHDVLVDYLHRGGFFGNITCRSPSLYSETAVAQTQVILSVVGAGNFRSVIRAFPSVALSILEITATRLAAAQQTIRSLSAHPVEQRIAYILRKLASRLGEQAGDGVVVQLPLSREDLALMAGTTPETVSRLMRRFEKRAVVHASRKWVEVKDDVALAEISEGRLATR